MNVSSNGVETSEVPVLVVGGPVGPTLEAPATPRIVTRSDRWARVVCSTLPTAIFSLVYTVTSLVPALLAAIGAALLLLGWRLVVGSDRRHAVFGVLVVGISALLAISLGAAKGYFLPGILTGVVLFVGLILSVLVGWPLAGVIRHTITGDGQRWRSNPPLFRAYTVATLLCAALAGLRVGLELWLYTTDQTGWLAASRLVLEFASPAFAVVATLWLARRASLSP